MLLGRGECGLADADSEYATIDITIARAPISIGLAPKDPTRGGLSPKVHLPLDASGNLLAVS
jgi:hypothetical protein